MKSKYNFYIDSKHTVWMRAYHTIEASSEEEAKEIAKRIFKDGSGEGETEMENLSDTFESMSFEENGNQPTEELIWPGYRPTNKWGNAVILDNTPIEFKRDEKISDILENEK